MTTTTTTTPTTTTPATIRTEAAPGSNASYTGHLAPSRRPHPRQRRHAAALRLDARHLAQVATANLHLPPLPRAQPRRLAQLPGHRAGHAVRALLPEQPLRCRERHHPPDPHLLAGRLRLRPPALPRPRSPLPRLPGDAHDPVPRDHDPQFHPHPLSCAGSIPSTPSSSPPHSPSSPSSCSVNTSAASPSSSTRPPAWTAPPPSASGAG